MKMLENMGREMMGFEPEEATAPVPVAYGKFWRAIEGYMQDVRSLARFFSGGAVEPGEERQEMEN